MGRELKRVPMNFAHPLGETWPGYLCEGEPCTKHEQEHFPPDEYSPEGRSECVLIDPPEGDGYQLWETTSEGSPISPVFATLDELLAYAAEHCTTFGSSGATADEWRRMLGDGIVGVQQGPFFFC